MPPKVKAKAIAVERKPRRSTRNAAPSASRLPDVYQEMLADVAAETAGQSTLPPRKRQRLSDDRPRIPVAGIDLDGPAEEDPDVDVYSLNARPQTIYNDFLSSDEEDEFEDVDLELSDNDVKDKPEGKVLTFELTDPVTTPKRSARRPPVSMAERKMRLEWHKVHFFLLLLSVWCRNRWCESQQIQVTLRKLVPRRIIKLLHEDESKPSLQRSHSFNKAIEEICLLWKTTWTVVGKGMRRASWREGIDLNKEGEIHEELDFDDFRTAARTHRGSRDLGAQLFCALLRSVAVETRLVCSLQVLPFSAAAKGLTPEKSKQNYTLAGFQDFGSSTSGATKRKQKDSPYPIFWVEILSPVTQAWMPIDPVVRHTINKPKTGFEPPASDTLNAMAYVIAFEDDGSARDVTRRYAQWFNAKTRKIRVESTKSGELWLRSTLAKFAKPFPEVRDEIEDADLLKRSEAEGMPKNIQDFKGHPIYVLERHLRMNEVIHPRREVGMTTAGGSQKDQKLESVYRRKDVHLCRTSHAWYRRGRDIKQGEVPLKRVTRRTERTVDLDIDGHQTEDDAALYAEFQTEIYKPPPVMEGRVPRNGFGNLDVYVRSMIPPGAIHVRHPLAAKAAKLLGIDYADAVTGFEFKGRQGTAIVDGIVVARVVRFGLDIVITGMQNQLIEEAQHERSILITSLWKRWLTALRIRERVRRDYGGGSDQSEDDEDGTYHAGDEEVAGGFMPDDQDASVVTPPQANSSTGKETLATLLLKGLPPVPLHHDILVIESPHEVTNAPDLPTTPRVLLADTDDKPSDGVIASGGFAADSDGGGGFLVENDTIHVPFERRTSEIADQEGGGFLVEDDHGDVPHGHRGSDAADGGGFIVSNGSSSQQAPHGEQPAQGHAASAAIVTPLNGTTRTLATTSPPLTPNTSLRQNSISRGPLPSREQQDTGEISETRSCSSFEAPPDSQRAVSSFPLPSAASNGRINLEDDIASDASVLTHDPEEDDAEPEWLMDSLGT